MRTKRAIWITLLCAALVGALFVMPGVSTRAQGGWTCTWNFSINDGGFYAYEGNQATYIAGSYWSSVDIVLDLPRRITQIGLDFPATTITAVSMVYDRAGSGDQATEINGLIIQAGGLNTSLSMHDSPDGTNLTLSASGSTETTSLLADVQSSHNSYGGVAHIKSVSASGSGTPPCTQTPTITPTPSMTAPAGTPSGLPRFSYCPLLKERATFDAGWQLTGGADLNTTMGNQGLYLPGGSQATTSLSLSPDKRYQVYIVYKAGTAPPGSTAIPTLETGTPTVAPATIPAGLFFGWKIEGRPESGWQIVDISPTLDSQTYSSPAASYDPMSGGGYVLRLDNPFVQSGGVPLIQYICVSEERSGGSGGGGNQGSVTDAAACHVCADPQGIWDVQGIVNWLVCKIGQFLECTIAGFLRGLWETLVRLVTGVFGFFKWLFDGLGSLGNWAGSAVTAVSSVAEGQVDNVITSVGNGMHDSGLANGMNIVSSGMRDLPTALMNIVDQGGQIISNTFQSGANLLDIFVGMVNLVISTLGGLLALVPLIFQELVNGFNHATEPVSGSITCTDPNTLLWFPCYGFYVLDNTIFEGPAVYLLPILMGMMAFDTFIWALNKLKDAFAK